MRSDEAYELAAEWIETIRERAHNRFLRSIDWNVAAEILAGKIRDLVEDIDVSDDDLADHEEPGRYL